MNHFTRSHPEVVPAMTIPKAALTDFQDTLFGTVRNDTRGDLPVSTWKIAFNKECDLRTARMRIEVHGEGPSKYKSRSNWISIISKAILLRTKTLSHDTKSPLWSSWSQAIILTFVEEPLHAILRTLFRKAKKGFPAADYSIFWQGNFGPGTWACYRRNVGRPHPRSFWHLCSSPLVFQEFVSLKPTSPPFVSFWGVKPILP